MKTQVLEYAYGGVTFVGELARPACHGAADPFVSAEEVAGFEKELTEAGVDWHLLVNGGAGHGFTNPGASNLGVPGVAYDERAKRRSFAAMRDFFDALFGAP